MATTPRSDVLDAARSALAHMERLGESGWCLCVSASAPTEVEDALRDLIKLVEAEHPEPEWEYGMSEVLVDGTTAFGTPVESLQEAIRRRDLARINYPWPDEIGIGKRLKAGPWLPVGKGEQ